MKLKWSQFNIEVNSLDNKRVIIRNNLNGQVVSMTLETKQIIDSIINSNPKEGSFPSYIKNHLDHLTKLKILVPQELDEEKIYNQFLSKKQTETNKNFTTTIITTTSCQFNCSYCYEQGIKRQERLNTDTALKIALWCKNYLANHKNCDRWIVSLFGGEPLLNKEIIEFILPKLKKIARGEKIPFEVQITTNGELLDLQALTFLNKFNLKTVNISVDGPKQIHDKRRTSKNGKGSFDKIFQNITNGFRNNLLNEINLSIACDKQNIESLPTLFDYLVKNNLQKKVNLVFNMIYSSTSVGLDKSTPSSYFKNFRLTENQKAIKYLWLCQEAKKRGFKIPHIWELGPFCDARKMGTVVFQPNGTLLKCCRNIGHPEFVFGNIAKNQDANDPNFCLPVSLKKCFSENCPLIPICNGGCRVDGYFSNGNFKEPNCRKTFMEKVNKGLLQLNFD